MPWISVVDEICESKEKTMHTNPTDEVNVPHVHDFVYACFDCGHTEGGSFIPATEADRRVREAWDDALHAIMFMDYFREPQRIGSDELEQRCELLKVIQSTLQQARDRELEEKG